MHSMPVSVSVAAMDEESETSGALIWTDEGRDAVGDATLWSRDARSDSCALENIHYDNDIWYSVFAYKMMIVYLIQ